MFNNSSNLLLQGLPLLFSWSLSILIAYGISYENKISRINSITLCVLVAPIVFLFICIGKASKAIENINYLNFAWSFIIENKLAIIAFVINISVSILIAVVVLKRFKGRDAFIKYFFAFICVISAVVYAFIPNSIQPTIPANILAKSYSTIPIDFVLEENPEYFDNALYSSPKPLLSTSISIPSTLSPEITDDGSTVSPTSPTTDTEIPTETAPPPSPQTFTEYIDAYDFENRESDITYLKAAYELYDAGKVNKTRDVWQIARMWFGLGYYDINPDQTREYYDNAIRLYSQLGSWLNVGAAYYNIGDYDNAIANYRKAYQGRSGNDYWKGEALKDIIDICTNRLADTQRAINEYEAAVQYFSDVTQKINFYTEAAKLYLSSTEEDKLSKAINEYNSALKLNSIKGAQKKELFLLIAKAQYYHGSEENLFNILDNALLQKGIKDDVILTADIYEEISKYHSYYDNFDDRISALESAIEILGDCDRSAEINIKIAEAYTQNKYYTNAKDAYLKAFSMDGISDNFQQKARDELTDLAKSLYFSDYADRYSFVIESFNGTIHDYRDDLAFLYFQSLLHNNRLPDTPYDWLSYFEGKQESESSKKYAYHPKMLLYCAAIHIRQADEDGAKALLPILTEIYKKQPSNFNDADIINYMKLLIHFGMYNDATTVLGNYNPPENVDELLAHRNVIEASAMFFAKTLVGQNLTKNDLKQLYNNLEISKAFFAESGNQYAINSIEYLTVLLGQKLGEKVDYIVLNDYLPGNISANKYLSAFILYRLKNDIESAIKVCDDLLDDDPQTYDGFSRYDALLLDGEISYEYAKIQIGDRRTMYLNRSINDFETILQEIGYLYEQASAGLVKAREAKGEQVTIAPGNNNLVYL